MKTRMDRLFVPSMEAGRRMWAKPFAVTTSDLSTLMHEDARLSMQHLEQILATVRFRNKEGHNTGWRFVSLFGRRRIEYQVSTVRACQRFWHATLLL